MAAAAGTLSPAPKFVGLDDAGNPIAGGKLSTYYAGTTTLAPTYSDADLDVSHVNTNPVLLDAGGRATLFLNPGVSYKFILKTAADVVVWSQDNIAAVSPLQTGIDVVVTAGEDIGAGQAVYLSSGGGGKVAGRYYRGDSTASFSSTDPATVGIALAPILNGQVGSVRVNGVVTGLSGLVPGSKYYIGVLGALAAVAPVPNARLLGQADTTTSLVLSAGGGGASVSAAIALVDGATVPLDASQGSFFYLASNGDRTILAPTNPVVGQKIIIEHFANGTARTLALTTGAAGAFRFGSSIPALTQTASGKADYIGCVYGANFGGSFWDVVAVTKGF